jgi:hypothetical protein
MFIFATDQELCASELKDRIMVYIHSLGWKYIFKFVYSFMIIFLTVYIFKHFYCWYHLVINDVQ